MSSLLVIIVGFTLTILPVYFILLFCLKILNIKLPSETSSLIKYILKAKDKLVEYYKCFQLKSIFSLFHVHLAFTIKMFKHCWHRFGRQRCCAAIYKKECSKSFIFCNYKSGRRVFLEFRTNFLPKVFFLFESNKRSNRSHAVRFITWIVRIAKGRYRWVH